MKPLLIIAGPTASGKTALSIYLAQTFGGEIICADSMQIYKYMNIGTAKPTVEEQQGVPHHLFGIVDPNEKFSVAKYSELAHKTIAQVYGRNKVPILVGGTGLYIDAVANNIMFSDTNSDEKYTKGLLELSQLYGQEYLYSMLSLVDPVQAEKISMHNTKRIVRALEIYKTTGITKTEHDIRSKKSEYLYDVKQYGIKMDRDILYERINKRVDLMLEEGLVDEVKALLKTITNPNSTAMQGIGYKEIAQAVRGELSIEQATELVKKRSRNYAKRQITWFKRNENMIWIDSVDRLQKNV